MATKQKSTKSAEPKYTPRAHLEWILEGVIEREHHYAETGEDIDARRLVPRGEGEVRADVLALWATFEDELQSALGAWIALHPKHLPTQHTASEWVEACMLSDGALDVFMTLNGEGVGIWDGRWDHLVAGIADDHKVHTVVFEQLGDFLKECLRKFADDCGGGSLNNAFDDCAYKLRRTRKKAV